MKKLEKIAETWNKIRTDQYRWWFVQAHNFKIGLRLGLDQTSAVFHSSIIPDEIDYDDLPKLNPFKESLGSSQGVINLLKVLDIQAEKNKYEYNQALKSE